MKKTVLAFVASVVCFTLCTAQKSSSDQPFSKSNVVIHGGIAIATGVTPIVGSVEYGVSNQIGLGGSAYFYSFQGFSFTFFGARGTYHFNDLVKVKNLDLYSAAELLFSLGSGGGTAFTLVPGARYYFSDKIGAFGEYAAFLSSGGGSQLRFGVALKL